MKPVRAYKSDPQLKRGMLTQMRKHEKADQIVQGQYSGTNGGFRGCAVGCAVHSWNIRFGNGTRYEFSDHSIFPKELGIPEHLAWLQEAIFEALPKAEAVLFPRQFLSAIRPGADLSLVWPRFAVYLLTEGKKYANRRPDLLAVQDTGIALYGRTGDGGRVKQAEWDAWNLAAESATSAAWSAAESATSAAWSAARSAWSAAESATSAAWSAARSSESAARSSESAARSARSAAWSAAESSAWTKMRDKLLELLEAA